jgi:hypothetical protein
MQAKLVCLLVHCAQFTLRYKTGWILQILKSLSTFTQTAKWWQALAVTHDADELNMFAGVQV